MCDVAATITVTETRIDNGIMFSAPVLQTKLAFMVNSPSATPGLWGFLTPLATSVWIAVVMTTTATPTLVYFFESLFSGHSAYANSHTGLLGGLQEALWHGLSHTLSIDVFRVNTLPARIVTAAYAFLVLIISSTYTANLAIFLTTRTEVGITHIDELDGMLVSTVNTYMDRLNNPKYGFIAIADDDGNYAEMIRKMKLNVYRAIVADETQIDVFLAQDTSCSLRKLDETIEPFETAIAWRSGSPFAEDFRAMNTEIVLLRSNGGLAGLIRNNIPSDTGRCTISPNDTAVVGVQALRGLWVIMLVSGVGALLLIMWALLRMMVRKDKRARIYERMTYLTRKAVLPAAQASAARRIASSAVTTNSHRTSPNVASSRPTSSTNYRGSDIGPVARWQRGKELALVFVGSGRRSTMRTINEATVGPAESVGDVGDVGDGGNGGNAMPGFEQMQTLVSDIEAIQARVSHMIANIE